MRPVIGITTYAQDASWGVWQLPAALIPLDYVDAVERAGGRPILLPPSEDGVDETLDLLDGIVFSGGADVDPALYGAEAHPETDTPQARRDRGELALLQAALERDLPDARRVPRRPAPERRARRRSRSAPPRDAGGRRPQADTRDIRRAPGRGEGGDAARLHGGAAAGGDLASPPGAREGRRWLIPSAWAADGTLEGVEDPSKRFTVGVQWHPEAGSDEALFENLVAEARAFRAERDGR